jgi:Fic family protein
MPQPEFKHYDLSLIEPNFSSPLTDLIIELDHLKRRTLTGTTHPRVFFQLKRVFHMLESLGSARIEGNNTTIAEYIETKLDESVDVGENIKEIQNIEEAMEFIENYVKDRGINRAFISELHKIIVKGLTKEGDNTPGQYRSGQVQIAKSKHLPPEPFLIEGYMDELFQFINKEDKPKYDLLRTAIAHHRFVWIHPFGNGNGRTVRLFTYAMLVKQGYHVSVGSSRILNPTAIFCNNRNEYYQKLAQADAGTNEGILIWVDYVLRGLKEEIEKIDRLLDYDYLKKEILFPAINFSQERQFITETEAKVLKRTAEKQVIQAANIKDIFEGKVDAEVSRQIRKLIEKKMLIPEKEGTRKYVIRFDSNYLLRGIIKALGEKGFLPLSETID